MLHVYVMQFQEFSVFVCCVSVYVPHRCANDFQMFYDCRKPAMAGPLWNAASHVLIAVSYIAMAIVLPGSRYIDSLLVGICYGVCLTITVAAASELFGLKYHGLLYNILRKPLHWVTLLHACVCDYRLCLCPLMCAGWT